MTMRGGIWPILTTTPDANSPGGFVAPDPLNQRSASLRFITPGFFDAIGTPVLQGRDVAAGDALDTIAVAIVSPSFAREHFPDQDPIGRQFAVAFSARTIVGVVGDIRVRGLERESEPQVYLPASQLRDGQLSFFTPKDLVIRSSVPSMTLMPAVREIIAGADSQLPISDVQTLEAVVFRTSRRASSSCACSVASPPSLYCSPPSESMDCWRLRSHRDPGRSACASRLAPRRATSSG